MSPVVPLSHTHDQETKMSEQICESGNHTLAMTILSTEATAAAGRRVSASDQLSADSQRMWSVHMTTPTNLAAHGMRIAAESGGGRTRAETNNPSNTAAP